MTPLDIPTLRALAAAARERADKATAGPWRTNGPCVLSARQGGDLVCSVAGQESPEERLSTLRFIAAARTDVPALAAALEQAVAEVERLRAEIDSLRSRASELPGLTATLDAYDYELRRLRDVVAEEDIASIDSVLVELPAAKADE